MKCDGTVVSDAALVERRLTVASMLAKSPAEALAVISILMGAIAQLILKGSLLYWGAHRGESHPDVGLIRAAVGTLSGLGIYAAGTWFWWKAVSRASISYLYPLSAASYALVALGGRFIFGEIIQPGRWMGIVVIMLGVALLTLSSGRGSE